LFPIWKSTGNQKLLLLLLTSLSFTTRQGTSAGWHHISVYSKKDYPEVVTAHLDLFQASWEPLFPIWKSTGNQKLLLLSSTALDFTTCQGWSLQLDGTVAI